MSVETFKDLVEEYSSTVTNQFLLQTEYGSTFEEKVLNHKIRKHAKEKNFRSIAMYLALYTDYIGEEVSFTKDIIAPELVTAIVGDIYKNKKDFGYIAYGYFKESENSKKYFVSNVIVVKEPVKEKYEDITVVKHDKKIASKTKFRHTAIVKCLYVPVIGDISIACGYHPAGYGCWEDSIVKNDDGTYTATWSTGRSCD